MGERVGCWCGANEMSSSGELDSMSRGEVTQREDGWGVGDEGSSSGELGGMGRGGGGGGGHEVV